jgi:hypothetical protein
LLQVSIPMTLHVPLLAYHMAQLNTSCLSTLFLFVAKGLIPKSPLTGSRGSFRARYVDLHIQVPLMLLSKLPARSSFYFVIHSALVHFSSL